MTHFTPRVFDPKQLAPPRMQAEGGGVTREFAKAAQPGGGVTSPSEAERMARLTEIKNMSYGRSPLEFLEVMKEMGQTIGRRTLFGPGKKPWGGFMAPEAPPTSEAQEAGRLLASFITPPPTTSYDLADDPVSAFFFAVPPAAMALGGPARALQEAATVKQAVTQIPGAVRQVAPKVPAAAREVSTAAQRAPKALVSQVDSFLMKRGLPPLSPRTRKIIAGRPRGASPTSELLHVEKEIARLEKASRSRKGVTDEVWEDLEAMRTTRRLMAEELLDPDDAAEFIRIDDLIPEIEFHLEELRKPTHAGQFGGSKAPPFGSQEKAAWDAERKIRAQAMGRETLPKRVPKREEIRQKKRQLEELLGDRENLLAKIRGPAAVPAPRVRPTATTRVAAEVAPDPTAARSVVTGFREGASRKPLPPVSDLKDNYLKPLSEYTDRLFHETDMNGATFFLHETGSPPGDLFWANSANLARGQTGKGVLLEFSSEGVGGQINRNMPMWEAAFNQGEAEFITRHVSPGDMSRRLISVTVAEGTWRTQRLKGPGGGINPNTRNVRTTIKNWAKKENPDGSTTYIRPTTTTARAAAEVVPEPTAAPAGDGWAERLAKGEEAVGEQIRTGGVPVTPEVTSIKAASGGAGVRTPRGTRTGAGAPGDPSDLPQQTGAVQEALEKAEVIVKIDEPGAISRLVDRVPIIGFLRAMERPGVRMSPAILRAYIASTSEAARWVTRSFASRRLLLREIDEVFGPGTRKGGTTNARYIGTAADETEIVGTFLDVAQRTRLYVLNAKQRDLLQRVGIRNEQNRLSLVNEYGIEIGKYEPLPGSIYMPTVGRDKFSMAGFDTEISAATSGRAKGRWYDSASDRIKADVERARRTGEAPSFDPQTDLDILFSGLDSHGAGAIRRQVFKQGSGGKTRIQLMDELYPGLRRRKESLKRKITRLREQIKTAERQAAIEGGKAKQDLTRVRRAERRAKPYLERIEELGDEYGPELSFLSGSVRELEINAARLSRAALDRTVRAAAKGQKAKTLRTEIEELAPNLSDLQKKYATAQLKGQVLVQDGVFLYFPANESRQVKELLRRSESGVLEVINEVRATAFSGDFSPFTIQGSLGWAFDPIRTTRAWLGKNPKNIMRSIGQDGLARSVAQDLEGWLDFSFWTGFPASGRTAQEFSSGLLGRIPRLGPIYSQLNEGAFSLVLQQQKGMFERAVDDLVRAGYAPNIAKATAAEKVTQAIPHLNPVRLGQSARQAALWRAPFTSISFLRQPPALMNDALRGFAKVVSGKTLTSKERLSMNMMMNFMVTMTAITTSSAVMQAVSNGEDPVGAVKRALNPQRGWNLYIPFTKRYVPVGGTFRGLAKLIWPSEVKGLPVPVPFGNAVNFMKSRATPLFSTQMELIANEDFHGNPIIHDKMGFAEKILRIAQHQLEGVIPLAAASLSESQRLKRPLGDAIEETFSQFAGQNVLGESPYRERNSLVRRWAASQGLDADRVEGYWDLSPKSRKEFNLAHPGVGQAIRAEIERRASLGNEAAIRQLRKLEFQEAFIKEQLDNDHELETGQVTPEEWRYRRKMSRQKLNGHRDQWYVDADFAPREPETPLDFYFVEIDRVSGRFGQMTDEAWDELDRWVAGLTVEDQEYISENTGLGERTPTEMRYLEDVELLGPYWDLDKLFPPELAGQPGFASHLAELKKNYRMTEPPDNPGAVDAALIRWGYLKVPITHLGMEAWARLPSSTPATPTAPAVTTAPDATATPSAQIPIDAPNPLTRSVNWVAKGAA